MNPTQFTPILPAALSRGPVRDAAQQDAEKARVAGIATRRLYLTASQYDDANESARALCENGDLPEHFRRHAYSGHIAECVGYIADTLGSGFAYDAASPEVKDILDGVIHTSPVMSAYDEDGNQVAVIDDVLVESLTAGDCPVYVGWDPVREAAYLECWDCDRVEFVMRTTTEVEAVILREVVWGFDGTNEREMTKIQVWDLAPNAFGYLEARMRTWYDTDLTQPVAEEWLAIGAIPWRLIRTDTRSLRAYRGESVISSKAMADTDRFNAVEQLAYLIARYNSHANVAVVGDAASLKLQEDGRVRKDVADVLTFPGGTQVEVLELPTDPQMIDHQRGVLSESLYAEFGIARLDPASLKGLGGVTGYALEILNQRSAGTFARVARQYRKDVRALFDLVLDVTAWKRVTATVTLPEETQAILTDIATITDSPAPVFESVEWWSIDPTTAYTDRRIGIRLGSAGIVDDVRIRDDFTSGLISRAEALRQRGVPEPAIAEIQAEVVAEADANAGPNEAGSFSGSLVGSTVAGSTAR